MNSASNGSPVDYPVVEINGVQFKVKFGLGALYRLERFGISAQDLSGTIERDVAAGRNLQTLFAILAAALGTEDASGSWKPIGLTPEALADMLPTEKLGELSAAISLASGKVSPVETVATLPATETAMPQ